MGRSAEIGDEVGSAVITARQLREVMHLCFLLQRQYPPYAKWLETAFAQLDGATDLLTLMREAIVATSFKEREATLGAIYQSVAKMHNAAGITSPVDPDLQSFHDRPYTLLNSYRFVEATRNAIADENLRSMALHGCISQCVDSTDILSSGAVAHEFRSVLGTETHER